jgi:hypothetical protein
MELSVNKCKRFYAGEFRDVVVTSDNGETIQLPMSRFRPFMTSNGLSGRFRLRLSDESKFLDLEKTY